ncbi:MAG: hypothetical protein ACE5G0_07430 [Rhodothermales bacterium]
MNTSSSVSKTLSFSFPLTQRQSIVLTTEYMRVESFPKSLANQFNGMPAWRYKAVPITVAYSYALTPPTRRLVPIVGVGVSLYLGSAKQLETYEEMDGMRHSAEDFSTQEPRFSFREHLGIGYGAQATLGLRANLNRHLFVQMQGRASYINGLGFTGGNVSDFRSEFAKLDFALGLGLKL